MMKAKAEFVTRAWTQNFTEGIFDDFDEIFCARDNGGHFRNYAILKFESEIGFRYQKIYRVRSYAPHHGYNHADRHGAQVKGWIRKAGKRGDKFKISGDSVQYLNKVLTDKKYLSLDTTTTLDGD